MLGVNDEHNCSFATAMLKPHKSPSRHWWSLSWVVANTTIRHHVFWLLLLLLMMMMMMMLSLLLSLLLLLLPQK
jgi:hypothetical protein